MSAPKERPIGFDQAMLRAIFQDAKTQTRRPIKRLNGFGPIADFRATGKGGVLWNFDDKCHIGRCIDYTDLLTRCPYGQPGGRLWVKESFWGCDMPGYGDIACVVYDDEWRGKEYSPKSIRPYARKFGRLSAQQMPREASRITLEIIDVRVELLQSITELDARAEGVADGGCLNCGNHEPCQCNAPLPSARDGFIGLWGTLYGRDSWLENPYIWVIKFKRVEQDK